MSILKIIPALFLFLSYSAKASLVPTIHTDTSNALDISWQWSGESPSVSMPTFSNWHGEVDLTINLDNHPYEVIGVLWVGDPTEPFTIPTPLLIFGDLNTFGTLTDAEFTYLGVDYHFLFERDIVASNSNIRLTATVVPIQGAYLFYLSAMLPLLKLRTVKARKV